MSRSSLRGLLAVTLPGGLYALVGVLLLAIVVFDYLALTHGGGGTLKFAFVLSGAGIAMVRGIIIVDRNSGEQTRGMYIGLPLLLAYRMDEVRAVLAHELGHYSGKHTRSGQSATGVP